MAVKAHLRNQRPVLIAVSTNDGLGQNAVNLGRLLNSKNIFFVPFAQDNPEFKPNSLVAHMNLLPDAAEHALRGMQLQPVLRGSN
ncbi:MAG: Dipicolinate synthase subunit B [Firmicutes bacterium]|nr:Dipicolinate synthase subunit B [Bacillota bacterium]